MGAGSDGLADTVRALTRVLLGVPLGLAIALVSVWLAYERPVPPATAFRMQDARADLERLARAPRPTGSPAHAEVRAWLAGRLASLGHAPVVQEGERDGVEVANLLVRVEGSDSTGTVLFAAHYDSRAESPGAGDDGAAVACLLSLLGRADLAPRNDLVFLLSDGEEDGLCGARLFAEEHPWMEEVACVLNFDAIGNDGPVVLFQTGPGSGAFVQAYARSAPHPVTSSLAPLVYARLPNDTDFTPFLAAGKEGLNFAIVGGGSAYHAPFDLAEHLAPETLQRLGDTMWSLADELGSADLRAGAATGRVPGAYFDASGQAVVLPGPAATRFLAAGAVLLLGLTVVVASRRAGLRREQRAAGLASFALFALGAALLLVLEWWLLDRVGALIAWAAGGAQAAPVGNAASNRLAFWGLVLLFLSACSWRLELFRLSADGPAALERFLCGGLVPWAALVAVLTVAAPDTSAQLPLALVLGCAAILAAPRLPLALPLLGCVAVALLVPHLSLAFQLLSTRPWKAACMLALVAPAGSGLLLPWLARHRPGLALTIALELAGSALVVTSGRLAALGS